MFITFFEKVIDGCEFSIVMEHHIYFLIILFFPEQDLPMGCVCFPFPLILDLPIQQFDQWNKGRVTVSSFKQMLQKTLHIYNLFWVPNLHDKSSLVLNSDCSFNLDPDMRRHVNRPELNQLLKLNQAKTRSDKATANPSIWEKLMFIMKAI